MMRAWFLLAVFSLAAALGCGNPMSRDPNNVYPGSDGYSKRVDGFKISPSQAYKIAYDQARGDEQLHYLSRKPTVIVKRWYVFSVPLASGANLQGYHVNGDTGEVRFFKDRREIPQTKVRS